MFSQPGYWKYNAHFIYFALVSYFVNKASLPEYFSYRDCNFVDMNEYTWRNTVDIMKKNMNNIGVLCTTAAK